MTNSIKTLGVIAISALFLSIAACKESELPVPLVNKPVQEQPVPANPSTGQAPGNPAPGTGQIPPGNDTPSSQTPSTPSEPSIPGVLRKIKWAPLDYKEFEYNTQGGLVKYNRQYNSVQGTDIVNRDEYTYEYAADKIISVTSKSGIRTEYTYAGEVWSEALSFDKLNRPLKKYQFQFNPKQQLTEYAEFNISLDGNVTPRSKTSFAYDAAGNLTRYIYFWYVESSNSFVRSTELQFSNFDSKKYPRNADSFDYILQPLTFFVNNPGKKEILSSYNPIEHYSYSYDAHGFPTHKRTSYTYDKPLPAMEATFEY